MTAAAGESYDEYTEENIEPPLPLKNISCVASHQI
jgi:hypothetical protein